MLPIPYTSLLSSHLCLLSSSLSCDATHNPHGELQPTPTGAGLLTLCCRESIIRLAVSPCPPRLCIPHPPAPARHSSSPERSRPIGHLDGRSRAAHLACRPGGLSARAPSRRGWYLSRRGQPSWRHAAPWEAETHLTCRLCMHATPAVLTVPRGHALADSCTYAHAAQASACALARPRAP